MIGGIDAVGGGDGHTAVRVGLPVGNGFLEVQFGAVGLGEAQMGAYGCFGHHKAGIVFVDCHNVIARGEGGVALTDGSGIEHLVGQVVFTHTGECALDGVAVGAANHDAPGEVQQIFVAVGG